MVILDGNKEGLAEAATMVAVRPNAAHLEEDHIMTGRRRDIVEILDESLKASAVVAYAVRDGEAMLGGVSLEAFGGLFTHLIWLLTTADATERPKWLLQEGRRMLRAADKHFKWPFGYIQAIPGNYPEGINYAKHMGFRETRREMNVAVMERMIPRERT